MQRLWSTARSPSHDYGSVAHDDSLLIGIPPIVITGAGHLSTDGGDRSTRRCHRDGATSAPPPLARCHLTRPLFAELIGCLMGDGSIRGSTVELRGCSYLEISATASFCPTPRGRLRFCGEILNFSRLLNSSMCSNPDY